MIKFWHLKNVSPNLKHCTLLKKWVLFIDDLRNNMKKIWEFLEKQLFLVKIAELLKK